MKRWPKIATVCIGILALLGGAALYTNDSIRMEIYNQLGISDSSPSQPLVTFYEKAPVKMVRPAGLPILMYHKVGDEKDNDAVIQETLFRQQMAYLKEHNYHPISMQELYDYVVNGAEVPENPVVLTFDDGYADTYSVVYPILQEYGFAGTVFVNPGDVGSRLTWEQIREMAAHGITISNHGYWHKEMGDMSAAEQDENIAHGKSALAEALQAEPSQWFCYPYGSMNEQTEAIAKDNGILMALSMKSGWAHAGDNPLDLKRVWIGNAVDLPHFEERLQTEHYSDI